MYDGVITRLSLSFAGLCYTQALNLMASSSEDSKSTVQVMEIDNHSNGSFLHASESSNHSSHGQATPRDNNSNAPSSYFEADNSNHNHPPSASSRATSQLREMLQNPGVPKDRLQATSPQRHGDVTSPQPTSGNEFHRIGGEDITALTSPHQRHGATTTGDEFHRTGDDLSVTSHQRHSGATSPQPHAGGGEFQRNGGEDSCYKFKNNIKHRFNADLRHHTSSPTDSHVSDRMSLPDEDCKHQVEGSAPPPLPPALLQCGGSPHHHHHHHAFSPYQAPVVSELTVKIPDRTGSDGYAHQHWDSLHAETASSCGSNPSPPPAPRSSGSSSGYSTNGDNHPSTKGGPKESPLSPYSPPSPPQPPGVPIFALHPKGAFYIPLTLESSLLVPYMVGIDDAPPVLHPISISVNLGAHSVKVEEKHHQHHHGQYATTRPPVVQQQSPSSSFLMDKFHDRLVYYACPAKNGCV